MASSVGEASSSFPPSASIPPPPRSCTYHVFLSFSGRDTRNGLTGHLQAALKRKGIETFIDDKKLEAGKVISSELRKAIKESMFAIIVFSPNYASSSWCLDELRRIVKYRKKLGLSIVPVFYGVEPSDVRYQKGSFEKAFQKHEKRFGQNSKKVKGWRDALVQVANVSGCDFKNKHEATLVESIADDILKKLIPKLPSSTENLVGIASRVEEVMRHIGIGLNMNDVRFIGIWGMGGIGKTTIARTVYEAVQEEFEVSCFLLNVREARVNNKIFDKQKQLLAKANISVDDSDGEYDIQEKIRTLLRNKKVLLVLDDVSDEIELEKLAGKKDWFGSGSRIIITTRDIQFLKIYEAHGTCEVRRLVDSEASDLFYLKAFKQKKPDKEYLALAKEVVKYSGGLPLALEVLGSHLCGRSVDVWRDAIDKIKCTPFDKINDTLKISYNSLDVTEKNIFLDIACFFKGWEKDDVTKLLESCGYKGVRIGIEILINRSLVKTIEEYNDCSHETNTLFEMHDLLQDMGRSIVIQESPNNPYKRSRLWSGEDIDLVLANKKGSKAIQGIVDPRSGLSGRYWSAEAFSRSGLSGRYWSAKAFSNMTQLKLLKLDSADSLRDLSSLPTSLKVLHWSGYPLKTLPLSDQHYELVEIRLISSKIRNLWHGKKFLEKLKHLDLSGSCQLKQTPDLSGVPILETLLLKNCRNLTEVHLSVVQHKRLTLLDLCFCCRLKALPGKLEMSSLNELILNQCWSFEILPEFGECMKSLSRLSLIATSIKKLPTSLGCLVGLQDLDLIDCYKLECFPSITDRIPLLRIRVSYCHLKSFPPVFGPFPSLTDLDLSNNDFVRIPINIHDIPKLKRLNLDRCEKLQCLPELPSSIRELKAWACDSLDISEFNILSTVCGAFESPSQDPGPVLLEMMIPGSEIPSWFGPQQDGNSVSIPPCDSPPNDRLGIALCFLPKCKTSGQTSSGYTCVESVPNGNRFNTIRVRSGQLGGNHLHFICLTNDCFSDEFHQGTCLEICFNFPAGEVISMTTAARYVSKEDIKDLERSVTKRPPKKKKKTQTKCLI